MVAWKRWDDWASTMRDNRYPSPFEGKSQTLELEAFVIAIARQCGVPSDVFRERMASSMRVHQLRGLPTSGRAMALAVAMGHS